MTAKEAYEKICKFTKSRPGVAICREYDKYFGFFLLPPGAKKGQRVFVGGEMLIVNKVSGHVCYQDDLDVNIRRMRWIPVREDFGG